MQNTLDVNEKFWTRGDSEAELKSKSIDKSVKLSAKAEFYAVLLSDYSKKRFFVWKIR